MRSLRLATLLLALSVVSACGGSSGGSQSGIVPSVQSHKQNGSNAIKHVIIVIQENRSFDNLFATFPNANGTTTGQMEAVPSGLLYQCDYPYGGTIQLAKKPLYSGNDYEHRYEVPGNHDGGFLVDLDGGKMDGFDLSYIPASSKIDCTLPYTYVDPTQIKPYWDMATQYVLADDMFQTQGSSSFTAHQDLIAGATVVNYPVSSGSNQNSAIDNVTWWPWGCGNHSSSYVPVIGTDLTYYDQGPFPCFTYSTIRDLLDAKHVSWKFYAEQIVKAKEGAGIWSSFQAVKAVYNDKSEWGKKVVWPDTKIFADLKYGRLPAVSWVTPDAPNSDHPQESCKCDTGPSWVASIVNAVGKSKYWNSSAIIVVWDDWGGFYDHVPPPFTDNQGGLGFRVPMIVVSPYTQPHVEHTQYEFGSILKFIEQNWNLGSLGTTDQRATSIGNLFYYGAAPRKFKPIAAKYSTDYFLHQKPTGELPDSE